MDEVEHPRTLVLAGEREELEGEALALGDRLRGRVDGDSQSLDVSG
jgi:hypothetical protein